MKIFLISANTEPFPEPVFPLGTAYVGNALHKAGADVRIFDMRHHPSIPLLAHELKAYAPDRIGLSLRNIDNAAYPATRKYLPDYEGLVRSIREACDAPIILGGSAFSLFPEEILARLKAEAGITGEGEDVVEIFRNPWDKSISVGGCTDIDNIEFPRNIKELFPGFVRYRTIGIQTARGCPNQCIYCTYPHLEGRGRRNRSAGAVAGEISMLHQDFAVKDFFMVDSLFNGDEEHMVRVLEHIAALKLPIRFSCYMQPKCSDPEIFVLLKKAGCVAVDFGTDTGSMSMLSSLRKPFTKDDIRKASRSCGNAGIDYCHSLLFGGPGETQDTVRETVGLMDEVCPRAVIAMTGIRIYPGTEVERIAREQGVIHACASLLEPGFYFPAMGSSKLLECVYGAEASRKNWFFPGKRDWGSAPGFKVLRYLYRKGPLWRVFRRPPRRLGGHMQRP